MAVSTRAAPGLWPRLGWPTRLVNRLLGGLAARIDPPGLASRRRYVLQHAGGQGLALQAEAVETIAQAADGYRTLDGWIARLALEARLNRQQEGRKGTQGSQSRRPGSDLLDPRTVADILAEETVLAEPIVTIEAIARAVADHFRVRLALLRGPSRRATVVEAHHLAMYLARLHSATSFAAIGTYFGGRDAATVRHACKAAVLRLDADPALAAVVATLGRRWQKSEA